MTTTRTRILRQVQDLIDDTARPSVHPQAGVANPDEIAQALADAGFLITEDVIVIPRTDLPDVREEDQTFVTTPLTRVPRDTNPAKVRAIGLAYLALAERLDAEPPIDEAQVDALAKVLSNEGDGGIWESFDTSTSREVARRLVQAGVRAPEEPK